MRANPAFVCNNQNGIEERQTWSITRDVVMYKVSSDDNMLMLREN